MLWADFYDYMWNWADSTIKTRISALETIGTGDEIVDAMYFIDSEKIRAQLLRKAMKLGAVFSAENFGELTEIFSGDLCVQLAQYTSFDLDYPYFDENNLSWEDFYEYYSELDDEKLIRCVEKLNKFGSSNEVSEAIQSMPSLKLTELLYQKAVSAGVKFTQDELESLGKWEPTYDTAQSTHHTNHSGSGFGAGLFAFLGGLINGLSTGSSDGHAHRCNGDCASCPAHYGYRYGRWYYGHGHTSGCERGGNGGTTGRTHRD